MDDMSQFMDIFLMEAEEHIQKLNENILTLEKIYQDASKGDEAIKIMNELMRSSHTIKGSSASMGFLKLAFLTHVMEDIFDSARNKRFDLTPELINKIFDAIDMIEKSARHIKETGEEIDTDALSAEIKAISGVQTEGVGKSVHKPDEQAAVQAPATNAVVAPAEQPASPAAASVPEPAAKADAAKASAQEDRIEEEAIETSKINYIKVPVERLEVLMDLVEELLIDRMRLEQLAIKNTEIKEVANHISLLVSGIQFQVTQTRLVPLEQVFGRFPRMIRDLALKQNKKIEFQIIGNEVELDRTIIDKIGEPLIHLLRNAVDHGIRETGNISLQAARESDRVVFIVENDDQSIDFEKVRASAVKRNIATAEEAANYTIDELTGLLFHPRLSTRDVVTEISGRGVGLSVVKKFVDALNGRVLVENLNPGVRFRLELPLTLAIIDSLLVQIKEHVFALPFTNIERSVRVSREDIKQMADRDVAIVDGVNVPLLRFSQAFKQSNQESLAESDSRDVQHVRRVISAFEEEEDSAAEDVVIVLLKRDTGTIGLVVSKLINVQEIIVKPLSPVLKGIKGFSGSTILGDGQAILILDVMNVVN